MRKRKQEAKHQRREGLGAALACGQEGGGVVGLRKGQMAAVLQISVRSLNRMMQRGEIRYWKIGRLVRFRMEDAVKRMNETVLVAGEEEPAFGGKSEVRSPKSDVWMGTKGGGL